MRISEEAVARVKGELVVNREKRKAIQKMDSSTLGAYLVDIYRSGFEDGANMILSNEDEVKMDWDDVLGIIAQFVDDSTVKEIDKKVKEMAG